MSTHEPHDVKDPLLAALRALPAHADDEPGGSRREREARAAYARAFDGSSWSSSFAGGTLRRAAVPLVLAGVVGVYLSWAVAAAASLVQ